MATKTYCDKCKKVKKEKDDWVSLSLGLHLFGKENFGLKSSHNSWDLCEKCGKKFIPKILNVLKK